MQYKVINFGNSNNPSQALETALKQASESGWIYVNHQYSDKMAGGSAGCFGFGATPPTLTHVGFVIFKKED